MKRTGFTIIELLVTIVIIAILSAIVLVGYRSWQQRIATSEVKSDLMAAASAMKNDLNFKNVYPTSLSTSFSASQDVTITWATGSNKSFCINGVSKTNAAVQYYITEANNQPLSGSCTVPVAPTPTITAGSATCGNNGGANAWANVSLTWSGQPSSTAPTYRVYQGSSLVNAYNNSSVSPGNLTTTFTSVQWPANSPMTLTYTVRSVNTMGVESPNSNSWSKTFAALAC